MKLQRLNQTSSLIASLISRGLSLCVCALLASCGPKSNTLNQVVAQDTPALDTQTGALNPDGRAYTGFGPEEETRDFKSLIPITPETKDFSKKIDSIEVSIPERGKVVIDVRFVGESDSITFKGSLVLSGNSFKSEARSDVVPYVLFVDCESEECANAKIIFKQPDGKIISGAIVKREERGIRVTDTDGRSLKPRQAEIDTMVVVPGPSKFKLREANVSDPLVVEGELVQTEGDCFSLATSKPGRGCLVGNSEDGELMIRYSPDENAPAPVPTKSEELPKAPVQEPRTPEKKLGKDKQRTDSRAKTPARIPKNPRSNGKDMPQGHIVTEPETPPKQDQKKTRVFYIETLPRASAQRTQTEPQYHAAFCGLNINSPIHPLLAQLSADCSQPAVQKEIALFRKENFPNGRRKDRSLTLADFLNFFQLSKAPGPIDRDAVNMGIVMETLKRNQLPLTLSLITLVESRFTPSKINAYSGAAGLWQFMPQTAKSYGLVIDPSRHIDQRLDVALSTKAAAKHLGYLINYKLWKGDLKLALAAYNAGHGTVGKSARPSDIPIEELATHQSDFWRLYKFNVLKLETRNYVPRVLAAMLISMDPTGAQFSSYYPAIPAN